MQEILDMAKAHLQNVLSKIQELESQQKVLENEIVKLKNYFADGQRNIDTAVKLNSGESVSTSVNS